MTKTTTAPTAVAPETKATVPTVIQLQMAALAKMRQPFPDGEVGYRPMPLVKKAEYDLLPKGKCKICGGYHALDKTGHLSYVGHAAITNRLLDCDPLWELVPLAFDAKGLPQFDESGGLWAKLTVAGVTRLCYGNSEPMPYSEKGARDKAVIGDTLRNGCMRFGAALELWHKGTLGEPDPVFEYGPAEPVGKPAVVMPEAAVAAGNAKVLAAVPASPVPAAVKQDEPLAEEGEVNFITKKLAALKVTNSDKLILDTIGTGTLEGLTKANFALLKEAVKGKK